MNAYYILDNRKVVPAKLMAWAAWFDNTNRTVASDHVGAVRIITLFLGIDHHFGSMGPPKLFETTVFGGPLDGERECCATWEEAEAQHALIVAKVTQ